ncbi:hypothetical protein [Feifania hominis]|uniref:Uncharacterized protein n=1 Tax=Feifania hominis TaxID=2763660 RepID=A0A926DER5_9FIRM|nr:hypothetical protein [Feifania hominis]MBC8535964.1 hypothetical protein [Feifania hominis]
MDYEAAYRLLFNTLTDIDRLIRRAQLQAEQMYLEQSDIVDITSKSDDDPP